MRGTDSPRPWMQVSKHPARSEALSWRRDRLHASRRDPEADRVAYLVSLARGKRVLDIGIVEHELAPGDHPQPTWLHGHIASRAAYCLGIDILESDVARLKELGYNVRCLDITDPQAVERIGESFDLVICGEIIEHLDNPGSLIAAAARLIRPGGRIVLTTPNPFYLATVFRHWLGRANENADHVCYSFPSGLAELAERHGLSLECYRGTMMRLTAKHRFLSSLRHVASFLAAPELLYTNIIYEMTHLTPANKDMSKP